MLEGITDVTSKEQRFAYLAEPVFSESLSPAGLA